MGCLLHVIEKAIRHPFSQTTVGHIRIVMDSIAKINDLHVFASGTNAVVCLY